MHNRCDFCNKIGIVKKCGYKSDITKQIIVVTVCKECQKKEEEHIRMVD